MLTKGGKPFTKQTIYKMLHNRMYLGQIVHKGQSFPGQHQAIITQAQWDAVHALIATDGIERRRETNDRQSEPILLRGLLFTFDGERLVPSYTVKKGKTYRYYTPIKHRCFGAWASQHGSLPAAPLKELVTQQIVAALSAPHIVQSVWDRIRTARPDLSEPEVVLPMRNLAGLWQQLLPAEQCRLAQLLIERVVICRRRAGNHLARPRLAANGRRADARHHRRGTAGMGTDGGIGVKPRIRAIGAPVARDHQDGGQVKMSTFISLKIRKRGASKVVVRPDGAVESLGKVATQIDQPLLVALTRAFYWQQLFDDGVAGSGSEIAQREGLHHSTVNELLRLTLLEPAIIQSVLAGQQPRCMSLL